MTFDELMKSWDWKPIRNCPGRYVLHSAGNNLRPQQILGCEMEASEYRVEAAKDAVLVVELDDGGLISYHRADGSFLHTLNTTEGFRRKLTQLGIDLH
ncbi:MAG: hypothetical protein DMF68_09580 [Acidobacteria bacterium]|nr:MAG: hypothetical protein DMF68_09580 [Acidobacteriota bacterium]